MPWITEPSTTAAHQVSNVYGIASTGNKVFSAQMVAMGPNTISSTTITILEVEELEIEEIDPSEFEADILPEDLLPDM